MTTSNPFANYSPDELEAQRRVVNAGYLTLTAAGFLAMTFFITHNMIGTEKPIWDSVNGLNWGAGQLAYLAISVGFAAGFNAFTWHFYQMESTLKQRAFVLFVAVAFPMFAEIGQSMTRAEQTRHEAATQSETFKIMKGRVESGGVSMDVGATTALSNAMADKAKAETELAACTRYTSAERRARCERIETGNINAAQARITAAQQIGNQTLAASGQQLKADAATLKELEGDSDFLQPIVKLMMQAGLPALGASFAVAFIIIGAMEVAMSYLGGLLRQLKDRMRELGLAVSSSKIQARYANGVSMSLSPAPMPGGVMSKLANGADSAKQTVAEYAQKVEDGLQVAPEVIATEYARAQHAREQVYTKAADKLDGIQESLNDVKEDMTRQRFFKLMYMEVRARVINGDLKPTVRPVSDAITEVIRHHTRTLGLQPSLIGKPERQKIAEKILDKLFGEGILIENPEQGVGHPRYLLHPRWVNKPSSDIPYPIQDDTRLFEGDGKQMPEQREWVLKEYARRTGKTLRQELAEGEKVYSDSPLDMPRPAPHLGVDATVKQIQQAVKASGATSPDAIRAAVFDAFAAMPNPAPLGDAVLNRIADKLVINRAHTAAPASSQLGIPSHSSQPSAPSQTSESSQPSDASQLGIPSLDDRLQRIADDLYPAWIAEVRAKTITPAKEPGQKFIWKFDDQGDGKTVLSANETGRIWLSWQDRAANDGVLAANPKYQPGNRQPKYLLTA